MSHLRSGSFLASAFFSGELDRDDDFPDASLDPLRERDLLLDLEGAIVTRSCSMIVLLLLFSSNSNTEQQQVWRNTDDVMSGRIRVTFSETSLTGPCLETQGSLADPPPSQPAGSWAIC